jgi:hypothetical protein
MHSKRAYQRVFALEEKRAMAKPVTGQYEYLHRSGVGLDYFTSRVDRLTLFPNGRFALIVQDRSRVANAAQSLMNGQQVSINAPETRREGNYSAQGNILTLYYEDGTQLQGQFSWNGEGVQLGPNFFNKVSDSTMLPPTDRLKKDMEDIAKGLKIAGTIGSIAIKAAKGIHDTIQATQVPAATPSTPDNAAPPSQASTAGNAIPQQAPYIQQQPAPSAPPQPVAQNETLFCDQCGARLRPGKRFCNQCGARLPI